MKKMYIACPYSKGDAAVNVRNAILVADQVAGLGWAPFIPVLTHFWHMLSPHDYEFWMKQDMEWLKLCDAVVRLGGESAGADREVRYAISKGIPVYHSVFEVPKIGS